MGLKRLEETCSKKKKWFYGIFKVNIKLRLASVFYHKDGFWMVAQLVVVHSLSISGPAYMQNAPYNEQSD